MEMDNYANRFHKATTQVRMYPNCVFKQQEKERQVEKRKETKEEKRKKGKKDLGKY